MCSSLHSSWLWLHAGKRSMLRAKEAERINQNVIWEPVGYRLTAIFLFLAYFKLFICIHLQISAYRAGCRAIFGLDVVIG